MLIKEFYRQRKDGAPYTYTYTNKPIETGDAGEKQEE